MTTFDNKNSAESSSGVISFIKCKFTSFDTIFSFLRTGLPPPDKTLADSEGLGENERLTWCLDKNGVPRIIRDNLTSEEVTINFRLKVLH